MAFNTQEQEIIKYGLQNGKSQQEVEKAISNYRAGVVPQKKTEVTPTQEPSLGSKLAERATTIGKEALAIGTAGASTISPQDIQEAKTNPDQKPLIALEAFNRAFQSPAKIAMAAGGAVGDVVGAGLKAVGIDKAIGESVAPVIKPVVQSEGARLLVQNFNKLPQQTQDYLKTLPDIANLIGLEVVPKAIATASSKVALKSSALDAIKGSSGNLTQKALDFISNDPGAKVETILKRSTPQELDNYLAIAEKSAQSGEAKSVFEVVGDKLAETTKTLKTKLDTIGAEKSSILSSTPAGAESFRAQTIPFIKKLEDIKNGISEIDKANLPKVQSIIDDATLVSTKSEADTFIDKVQDALYRGNTDMTIPQGSALDKTLRRLVGEYNSSLKSSLPETYTTLNSQYSKLADSLNVINKSLGQTVGGVPIRGASLIKQYFSPAGSKAKEIFEFIKKETNGEVDLAKDATLAKFAGQLYNDPNVNSLLGGIKDIPTTPGAIVGKAVERLGGQQITDALRRSTIQKAKRSALPATEAKNVVNTTTQLESKLSPSDNTTPTSQKGKGIRGMVNPSGLLPEKKVADSLEQEARKYKSAEEFVKAQGTPVYHGTDKVFKIFDLSKTGTTQKLDKYGMFFTSDKDVAKTYSSLYPQKSKYQWTEQDKINANKAIVMESFIKDSNPLTFKEVVDLADSGKIKSNVKSEGFVRPSTYFDMNRDAIKEAMDVTGKDVFKITKEGETFYMVNNPEKMFSKSQLIDIWNKANKK